MSSKAFRVVVNDIPHIINLNHVFKVTLCETRIKFYYTANNGTFGFVVGVFGGGGGSDIITQEIDAGTKEDAKKTFDDIAKLM